MEGDPDIETPYDDEERQEAYIRGMQDAASAHMALSRDLMTGQMNAEPPEQEDESDQCSECGGQMVSEMGGQVCTECGSRE